MRVDSYMFLPRSFRPLYERTEPPAGDDQPVWAAFSPRLAESRLALLTSAGLHVLGEQEPFDTERERREPTWGDPSWRSIPATTAQGDLAMTHLHVNPADVLADHDVALPVRVLADLVADGIVGATTGHHVSVMGYQEEGLAVWRERTAPEIAARLHEDGADGVVLAPV